MQRPCAPHSHQLIAAHETVQSAKRDPHYDRYDISRKSGSYKQCAGAKTRLACKCPSLPRIVLQDGLQRPIDLTDCIDAVPTVHFAVRYVPELWVVDGTHASGSASQSRRLQQGYTLEELNGRTDYCVNASGVDCTDKQGRKGSLETLVMSASQRDALLWEGSELYHFRVTVGNWWLIERLSPPHRRHPHP